MNAPLASILTAILPVLAIIGAGSFLRARGVVDASAQHGLMQVVIWVLMPCLVLDRVPHNAALNADNTLAWLTPLTGFASVAVGLALALAATKIVFAGTGGTTPAATTATATPATGDALAATGNAPQRRTFAYCVSLFNYGYVALPLCETLVGRDAVAVMLLFNAGIEAAMWTLCLLTLTGRLERGAWRRLVNPMTVGSVVALALNKSGAAPHMPDALRAVFSMLGGCAIPLGILLVGMALPALWREFSFRRGLREAAGAVALRNLLIPCFMALPVVAAMRGWCPALPKPLGGIIAIQAAMPAGIFPIVIAQHFGGDARVALRVAVWTSLAAVVTLPVWLWLLG
ncbi:MAG: AEC family transporter [Puniceicoccales bacterium]|nr:AEC family transporter [Puniceicoccales bacterium]